MKQTPLHLAARGGSIAIVQELVGEGAMVNAVDADGLTTGAYDTMRTWEWQLINRNHHFLWEPLLHVLLRLPFGSEMFGWKLRST